MALRIVDVEVVEEVELRGAAEHERHAARVPERLAVELGVGHLIDVVEAGDHHAVAVARLQPGVEAHRVDRDADLAEVVLGDVDGQAGRAARVALERLLVLVARGAAGDRHDAAARLRHQLGWRLSPGDRLFDLVQRDLPRFVRRDVVAIRELHAEVVAGADAQASVGKPVPGTTWNCGVAKV